MTEYLVHIINASIPLTNLLLHRFCSRHSKVCTNNGKGVFTYSMWIDELAALARIQIFLPRIGMFRVDRLSLKHVWKLYLTDHPPTCHHDINSNRLGIRRVIRSVNWYMEEVGIKLRILLEYWSLRRCVWLTFNPCLKSIGSFIAVSPMHRHDHK